MHPTEFIAESVIFSGGLQEKRQLFKRFAAHMKSSSVCFHKFDDRQMLMKGGEFPRQHTENIFTSLPMLAENKQYAKPCGSSYLQGSNVLDLRCAGVVGILQHK